VKVAVCVKQVPEPSQPPALDPRTRTLDRSGKLVLDEADGYGVELALQLVEAAGDGEVVVVSMAPRDEVAGLRSALAMGAGSGVLVSDPALAGADALGTAKVLAAVMRRLEPDLVVAATESTDGSTGTLPAQLAELLGLPMVTFARRVELAGGELRVERQTEAGFDEVTCPLPAVVSVTNRVARPRYPSFKGIVAAKSRPVERLKLADLGLDPDQAGGAGARQEITEVRAVEQRAAGEIVHDQGDAHERVLALLEELKVVPR